MGRHKGYKHSEKTRQKMSISRMGKIPGNYKNGIGIYRKIVKNKECFLRDNKDCSGRLEVHHLNSNREDNEPYNLLTVCSKHHAIIDLKNRCGRKKNIDKLIEKKVQIVLI